MLKGEGEAGIVALLEAVVSDRGAIAKCPAPSPDGEGPRPASWTPRRLMPARDLLRHRRKYFIGVLDPCASIEFSRGCPWDCSFCSAWTFYGRSYRLISPERVVEDLASLPGARRLHRRRRRLHTTTAWLCRRRGDRPQRNTQAILSGNPRRRAAAQQGGVPVLEEARARLHVPRHRGDRRGGPAKYRKRIPLGRNFEALEFARSLGIHVAINIIADPDWDEQRFRRARVVHEVPEIVNISVNTPYPGTENWHTEERRPQTRDYRLFDIQHAVLPTRLPLAVLSRTAAHPAGALPQAHELADGADASRRARANFVRGQTNFVRGIMNYNKAYNAQKMLADHARPVHYELPLPPRSATNGQIAKASELYIHAPRGRAGRSIDDFTQRFVETTRMGAST